VKSGRAKFAKVLGVRSRLTPPWIRLDKSISKTECRS
jgi:hypothetical protein